MPAAMMRWSNEYPARHPRPRRRGHRMRRRELMLLLGGAALPPLLARAQSPDRLRRIGVLTTFGEDDPLAQRWISAFRKELDQAGWREGRDVEFDYGWAADNADRLRSFAKQLVKWRPDVIFAVTTPAVAALLKETRTNSDRVRSSFRPAWQRLRQAAVAPGRQCHRLHRHQHRTVSGRKMGAARQGDFARDPARCDALQSSDCPVCRLFLAAFRGRRPRMGRTHECRPGQQHSRYRSRDEPLLQLSQAAPLSSYPMPSRSTTAT